MVWMKKDPLDKKPRYLRKDGDNVVLTRDKRGRLVDEIPEGFDVPIIKGRLRLIRK